MITFLFRKVIHILKHIWGEKWCSMFTQIFTVSVALPSFLKFQVSLWYHFSVSFLVEQVCCWQILIILSLKMYFVLSSECNFCWLELWVTVKIKMFHCLLATIFLMRNMWNLYPFPPMSNVYFSLIAFKILHLLFLAIWLWYFLILFSLSLCCLKIIAFLESVNLCLSPKSEMIFLLFLQHFFFNWTLYF